MHERPTSTRSVLRVVLGTIYALAALLGSVVLLFFTVFAISPTHCPDVGGSYLCTSSLGGLATFLGIGLLLLLFVGLAVGVPVAHTRRRALQMLAGSVIAAGLSVSLMAAAAASWSS